MYQLCFILYWTRFGNLSLCLKILQPLNFSRIRNCSSQVPWSEKAHQQKDRLSGKGANLSASLIVLSILLFNFHFFPPLPLGSVQALPWIRWWERALPDFVLTLSPGSGPPLLWQLHQLSLCRADGLECKHSDSQWSLSLLGNAGASGSSRPPNPRRERVWDGRDLFRAESDPFLSVCFRVTC